MIKAVKTTFNEMVYAYKLHRGDFDEPRDRFHSFYNKEVGLMWPKSVDYRIICWDTRTHA